MKTVQGKTARVPHPVAPADVKKMLAASPKAKAVWDTISPLARNEWICWMTSGKMEGTRKIRIEKGRSKMESGMRRPCCWAGCPHR
ncbi:MAG: YdeI/OmpD-associated family protein [Patescibacteria group bacterium]|nr:MAG: YdeI/OmpD-associated family protein [Patescibacteria group bacterium]